MAKLTTTKSKKPAQTKKNGTKNDKKAKAKVVDLDDDVADHEDDVEDQESTEAMQNGYGKHHEGQENDQPTDNSSSLLTDCEKYFGSRDLYSILNVDKSKANESEIKKAYYKLSLKYHPDKADETNRETSTIKFQVLSKIYSILSDGEKKKLYDEQGIVDDESGKLDAKDWNEYWRTLFKKVTKADFDKFFDEYRDSAEERADLLRIYEKHQGDMGEILDEMFTKDRIEDEPRFCKIIEEAIEKGEAKSYKKFSGESKKKAQRRKAAYEKEAMEAQVELVKQGIDDTEESLKQAIINRGQKRHEDFISRLEQKYVIKEKGTKGRKVISREDQSSDEDDDDDDESYETKPKKAKGASKASQTKKPSKAAAAKKVKRL